MLSEHAITFSPSFGVISTARLSAPEAAKILGFAEHDIPVLIQKKLLTPLGKPVSNAVKYFSWRQVVTRANDEEWLASATLVIYKYWQGKNARKWLGRVFKIIFPQKLNKFRSA